MPQFILSLDAGTTSSRAIVFDEKGAPVAVAQKEFRQIFPQPGWVEHDAMEIWTTQAAVAAEAVLKAGLKGTDVAAIGITNQRETVVVWDKTTGQPIHNAIVWQDRRTAAQCDALKQNGAAQTIKEKTGLVVDAYFSATKLQWILDHVAAARSLAEKGNLLFGTIDTWLLWKLTGGKVHATDVTNASRTLLFNIHTLDWDDDLLQLFNIPRSVLSQVRSSSELYGHTETILTTARIPIAGIAGDQQAALFGQLCLQPGMVKNTYGTGCFMLMNTGNKPVASQNNLLTTVAWKIGDDVQYALEGSVFIAGAVVQWLRDGLKLIHSSGEVESLIAQSEDNGGVYMVPAFTGLGAPYWNGHARGVVVGLSRGSTASHLARAAVESIAYQTTDVLQAMEKDSGIKVQELRVDGGATINNGLMQFQADVLNCKVVRPVVTETTALGAAFLAGLGVGFWKDVPALQSMWQSDQIFAPQMNEAVRSNHQMQWKKAVRAAQAWTEIG